MTKELVAYLRSIGNTDENGEPSAELLAAAEIEKLDADAAGAQAELASVKACWAEALENVATRNREIEQLRQERHQLRNELTAAGLEGDRLRSSFKNFHRLLCERFEYGHDEVDWERDQLSLIEWIAKRASHEPGAVPVVSPSHSLIALYAGCLCEWCKNERAKSALKSVSAHLPNQAQWCQDPDCPQCASQRTNEQ